ncbi:MAG: serine hydrolase domain-containing protein, partial [Bacteroidota bacterium]
MKMPYLLIFSFLCLWPSDKESPSHSFPTNDNAKVDALLTDFLAKAKLPGLSIAVNQSGELIYAKGFGYADLQKKTKMTPTTQIRTASVAKVITATAIGKLVSDGKLDLDAPLEKYLPYIEPPYASLTARQLAGHTAGVAHRPSSNRVKKKHYAEVRETMAFLKDMPLSFEADTEYAYSTLGYNLLALLIEEISGKKYVDYMREDVFAPLGMTQTFPDQKNDWSDKDAKMYFFKKGKLQEDKKPVDDSYKLAGAGFRSTSVDLVKMMNAYSNGFIAGEVVQSMFESHHLKSGEKTNVGIGWRLNEDMHKSASIEHAGSWQGARTVIVHYPQYQLTVSIMINAKCTVFIEETAQIIARLFLQKGNESSAIKERNDVLTVVNNKSDGTTETYKGKIQLSETGLG